MFAKTLKFWSLSMLLATVWAYASDKGVVAVLEIVVSEDTDDESKALDLTIQQTKFFTDELRKQAALTLAKNYTVLTRENIIALSANIPNNATTVVDIGRAIKSDYITNSSLSYLGGGLLVFTVELYNCESGLLVADFVKMAPDLKGLLDIIHENVPILFNKINPPEPDASSAAPANIPINTPQSETKPKSANLLAFDFEVAGTSVGFNIPKPETKIKSTNWPAIGLEVAGVAAIGFGLSQSTKRFSKISYITGGILLASGITIHILF